MENLRGKVDAQSFHIAGGGTGAVELMTLEQQQLITSQPEFVSVDAVFQLTIKNPGNLQLIVPVEWDGIGGRVVEILCIHGNGELF